MPTQSADLFRPWPKPLQRRESTDIVEKVRFFVSITIVETVQSRREIFAPAYNSGRAPATFVARAWAHPSSKEPKREANAFFRSANSGVFQHNRRQPDVREPRRRLRFLQVSPDGASLGARPHVK
jgi:hypothetical protein